MADITHDKITITGITYSNLINIEINKKMNTHSDACITCEVSKEEADAMKSSINDGGYVVIASTGDSGAEVLFLGVKYNLMVEENAGYRVAKLELKSTSYLLDKQKKKKTFQNLSLYYGDVLNQIADGKAVIHFNITDRKVLGFFMQNNETDWAMIVRLASGLGACVVANVTTQKPVIEIGVKSSVPSELEIGALAGGVESPLFVTGTNSTFVKGTLETTCITGKKDALRQEKISNQEAQGMMFTGIVQAVEKEKVQVFFDQIDAEYDSGGNTWFEYSAAYAGKGGTYGSGFYFMPEIGDRVRVFFPNGDDGEGFAFASETSYALDDPAKISWRAPGGQELLFTKDGISIIGKENSLYIDLRENEEAGAGIQIYSDTDVKLSTHPGETDGKSQIQIYGKEEVMMSADNQILLETPEATIEMDKDKIILNANHIYIN